MYSDENYLWGMVAYYLGCFLVLLFLWRFRELLPGKHFRNQLLLLIAAVILVPIKAYPDTGYLAPAWFVSLFEGLTGSDELGFLRGAQPIVLCYLAASLLYITWAIVSRLLGRKAAESTETDMTD
ncbi:MAG: hypothetical protein R3E57_03560 [Porticoccaceae bacterium]